MRGGTPKLVPGITRCWEHGVHRDPQQPRTACPCCKLGSEVFALEAIPLRGCCSSFPVAYFPVTLLPKELSFFGRQPEKEIKRAQFLNQPNEESLEAIAKELETELEQEKMHLLQAKEEKIQQFQEEMRQQEDEEAQKLHQQKEKSLRYFPFLVHLPCFSWEPFPAVVPLSATASAAAPRCCA